LLAAAYAAAGRFGRGPVAPALRLQPLSPPLAGNSRDLSEQNPPGNLVLVSAQSSPLRRAQIVVADARFAKTIFELAHASPRGDLLMRIFPLLFAIRHVRRKRRWRVHKRRAEGSHRRPAGGVIERFDPALDAVVSPNAKVECWLGILESLRARCGFEDRPTGVTCCQRYSRRRDLQWTPDGPGSPCSLGNKSGLTGDGPIERGRSGGTARRGGGSR